MPARSATPAADDAQPVRAERAYTNRPVRANHNPSNSGSIPGRQRPCRHPHTGETDMPSALEDKDAIREVLADYCFCLDGGRFAEMAALFAPDGTWHTAFGQATGRAEIAALAQRITSRAGPRPRGVHLVTNIVIKLDGDRAQVASNWALAQNSPAGPIVSSGGAYADEMVRLDGRWRFQYRKIDRFIAAD